MNLVLFVLLPGQGSSLHWRCCLNAPWHIFKLCGRDGLTHLRILDCMPPPQDLLHGVYAPQAVHWPSADSIAANGAPSTKKKKKKKNIKKNRIKKKY